LIELIRKFEVVREACIKCGKPAISVCPNCGTLCQNHDAIHRHETGHVSERLNWEHHAQPNNQKVVHD